ncbi:hypothetical protein [Flavobacterium sp.]|uniref:hypothetical protein n=1 Tax=Flavobacterium sp. TaxID=239 RepID=UPI0031D24816
MKGFIKITDLHDREHYLNLAYILKFEPVENANANSAIFIVGLEKVTKLYTKTTAEEIADMIALAS